MDLLLAVYLIEERWEETQALLLEKIAASRERNLAILAKS
jgi:hypothetical protein